MLDIYNVDFDRSNINLDEIKCVTLYKNINGRNLSFLREMINLEEINLSNYFYDNFYGTDSSFDLSFLNYAKDIKKICLSRLVKNFHYIKKCKKLTYIKKDFINDSEFQYLNDITTLEISPRYVFDHIMENITTLIFNIEAYGDETNWNILDSFPNIEELHLRFYGCRRIYNFKVKKLKKLVIRDYSLNFDFLEGLDVEEIIIEGKYTKNFVEVTEVKNLKILKIYSKFAGSLDFIPYMKSLRYLSLGCFYIKNFDNTEIFKNLTKIRIESFKEKELHKRFLFLKDVKNLLNIKLYLVKKGIAYRQYEEELENIKYNNFYEKIGVPKQKNLFMIKIFNILIKNISL